MKFQCAILGVVWVVVSGREKREAQTQNCLNSQCGQNNLNLSPFTTGLSPGLFQGLGPFGGFGLGYGGGFGGGFGGRGVVPSVGSQQIQNCVGSQCQQNNQNVQSSVVGAAQPAIVTHTQTQSCVQGQCQQNNHNVQYIEVKT